MFIGRMKLIWPAIQFMNTENVFINFTCHRFWGGRYFLVVSKIFSFAIGVIMHWCEAAKSGGKSVNKYTYNVNYACTYYGI